MSTLVMIFWVKKLVILQKNRDLKTFLYFILAPITDASDDVAQRLTFMITLNNNCNNENTKTHNNDDYDNNCNHNNNNCHTGNIKQNSG